MNFVSRFGKYFLALTPTLLFLGYYFSFRSPSPIVDDFWHFVDFEVLVHPSTFIEKFKLLFIVRNSHICFPTYLISLIQVLTYKQFSTHLMTSIGVLFLFLTLALFYKAFNKTQSSKVAFPLLLVSLTPQIYSIIFFPLVSLQVCITFFMVVSCSYLLAYKPNSNSYRWAVLIAVITTFSNGNGMIVWPMGAILMFLQGKKNRKQILSWASVGAISIVIYLILFSFEKRAPGHMELTPLYFFKVLIFNLSFLGNALDFFPSLIFTESSDFGLFKKILLFIRVLIIIGFTSTILFVFSKKIYTYYKKQKALSTTTLFTLGVILYILGSGFIGGIFRAYEGYGIAVSARYKYYGMIGLVSMIVYASHVMTSRQYKGVIWFSVVYFVASFACYWSIGRDFTNQANASLMNINSGKYTYIHKPYGEYWNNVLNHDLITTIKQNQLFDFKKAEADLGSVSNSDIFDQPLKVTYRDGVIMLSTISLTQKIKYDFILRLKSLEDEVINIPFNTLPLIDYESLSFNPEANAIIYSDYIPNGTYELFLISKIVDGLNQQKLHYMLVKRDSQITILSND